MDPDKYERLSMYTMIGRSKDIVDRNPEPAACTNVSKSIGSAQNLHLESNSKYMGYYFPDEEHVQKSRCSAIHEEWCALLPKMYDYNFVTVNITSLV
jgi:hypothetical protein